MALAATNIVDAIVELISPFVGENGNRFRKIQKDPLPQFQPEDFPAVAVYVVRTNDIPEGDGNEGNIKFITDATIMIAVGRKGGTKSESGKSVNDDADDILTTLFTDPDFTRLGTDALFESVEHIERTRVDPQEGDSYYSFVRLAITFRTRQEFLPVVKDPYHGADVTVAPLDPAGSPHVTAKWNEEND